MEQPFGAKLVAGDTWAWTVCLSKYPASSGYAAHYFFRGKVKLDIDATTNADGASFDFAASAADTADLTAGTYAWQLVVTKDADRAEIARGTVEVLRNIETLEAGADARSWVKRTLDAVCAVLESRASRVEEEYQINGRMLRLMKPEELMKWRSQMQTEYEQELRDSGQGKCKTGQIGVMFQ